MSVRRAVQVQKDLRASQGVQSAIRTALKSLHEVIYNVSHKGHTARTINSFGLRFFQMLDCDYGGVLLFDTFGVFQAVSRAVFSLSDRVTSFRFLGRRENLRIAI